VHGDGRMSEDRATGTAFSQTRRRKVGSIEYGKLRGRRPRCYFLRRRPRVSTTALVLRFDPSGMKSRIVAGHAIRRAKCHETVYAQMVTEPVGVPAVLRRFPCSWQGDTMR